MTIYAIIKTEIVGYTTDILEAKNYAMRKNKELDTKEVKFSFSGKNLNNESNHHKINLTNND